MRAAQPGLSRLYVVAPQTRAYLRRNCMKHERNDMLEMTRKAGLFGETIRVLRAFVTRLSSAGIAEPCPYWTDYLRDTRERQN